MSRFHSYLNSAVTILSGYDGTQPFSLYIKRFFSRNKKYGSRDRWLISDYCFFYFRLGRAFQHLDMEERILTGIFLCSTHSNRMLETHRPDWDSHVIYPLDEKLKYLGLNPEQVLEELFPWRDQLSEDINAAEFARSYFIKPDVFLRIRPGKGGSIRPRLKSAHIPYLEISPDTISVSPKEKVDRVLSIDSTVVIQDLSSQKVGAFLSDALGKEECRVWDCCAASGGKSILAVDANPAIQLTVTDIRPQILENLDQRFEVAGITDYHRQVLDLANLPESVPNAPFDVIIADVPCTGSGTWGRNPEQLFYFEEAKIGEYAALQRTIVSNAISQLTPGGSLVYITCSVYREENEENVEFFQQELGLDLVRSGTIPGYELKADSMFAAVLRKG